MLDDRGHEVEVLRRVGFCAWPVAGDRRMGVMRARVRAEMAGLVVKPPLRERALDFGVMLSAIPLLFAPMFVVMRMTGPTVWMLVVEFPVMLAWAAGMGYVQFRVRRARRGERVAREIQREGLCASCGYNLCGSDVESDGCVVCPECGAAWGAGRMRRREPFVAGATMRDSLDALVGPQGKCVVAIDGRGEKVVVPRGMLAGREPDAAVSDDAEAVGRVRKLIRRRRGQEMLVVVGICACLFGAAMMARVLESVVMRGAVVSWLVIGGACVLIVGGLGFNRFVLWSRKTVTGMC